MDRLRFIAPRISQGASLRAIAEGRSAVRDDQGFAIYRNSLRGGLVALMAITILSLSTACGLREPVNVLTPTPSQSAPAPTEEPTATSTPFHEDAYEPNDSMIQAFGPVVPGQEYQAYINGKEDIDFFYFEIEVPEAVTISLTDIPAEADYDLYLVTAEEDVLSSSASSGEVEERIEYTTSSVGIFYILVLPFHNFSETEPYSLRLESSPAPTPSGTDGYEPNDSFEQAAGPLAFEQVYRSYVWDEADTDIYLLQVEVGGTIAIDLTEIPTVADYDLFLYDEAGNILASSKLRISREHIERYLSPGIYYVSVESFAGFSRNEPYSLQVAVDGR